MLYDRIFAVVKLFLLSAPKFFGGFEGVDLLDVCSQITGVSSVLLLKTPAICDERLDTFIHGKAVIVCTALVCFGLSYFPLAVRYLLNIPWRLRAERHKAEANAARATKAATTRDKNQQLLGFYQLCGTVLASKAAPETKCDQIGTAWRNLQGVVNLDKRLENVAATH